MKVPASQSGQVTVNEARQVQRHIACRVSRAGEIVMPRLIAGVDISVNRGRKSAIAAVVVLDYPGLNPVERQTVEGYLGFPYIPGLLSFREAPLILAACARLELTPDLLLVDGQGLAHPLRCGLASHLGVLLDVPTIGCAKSRLCGSHEPPGIQEGDFAELIDEGEVIGAVVRTRRGVKPVYTSIGHRVDLQAAIRWTLACCRGYRLPEPTRLAHIAAKGNFNGQKRELVETGYSLRR